MAARPVRDVFPVSDTTHGNDPYMHNSTGSRQVTWNQTEGRKGVVVLAYSEDDIRVLGVGWFSNKTRDGFDGEVNWEQFNPSAPELFFF